MPEQIIIRMPMDPAIQAEVERRLAPHATLTYEPPAVLSLEAVQMTVEIAAGGLTMLKTLLELREILKQQGRAADVALERPGEAIIPLEDADEALLKTLLQLE
ncbi:MAG: hypothetical protein HC837_05325 [Chloroflexaceae bacterium]|nr:hypothetical protein [Chloroflexaceae bacterium]